jgi:hypothetical protein
LFGILKRRPLLDSSVVDWQFDCFAWLLRHSGGFHEFRKTRLIQPTDRFFPQRGLRGHELAEAIFRQVQEHARMGHWPCHLKAQERDPDSIVAPTVVVRGAPSSAAGTFSSSDKAAVVTYNPAGLADPMALVATFAHELAHYLTDCFPEEPPGGWENLEFATDIASVFLGFGIFAVNSSFTFSQYTGVDSQGWRARRLGYLSEPELLHAQAIFSALLDVPPSEVLKHLKSSLRGGFRRASKDVAAHKERLAFLKAVQPSEPKKVRGMTNRSTRSRVKRAPG